MKPGFHRALGAVTTALLGLLLSLPATAQSKLSGDWDVIVVGGGLMGSSTAWQLARANQRVLLLEKQDAIYTQGSSFGEARISRSLGPPGDIWSYMHNRAVAEAHRLVELLNQHGESADWQSDLPAWKDLCHVLFNTKEFIFVN